MGAAGFSTKDVVEAKKAKDDEEDVTVVQEEQPEFSETVVLDEKAKNSDNVGEASVQIDVESLVAEFEAEASEGVDSSGRIRRRLDAIMERKKRHEDLADFEDYDLDS